MGLLRRGWRAACGYIRMETPCIPLLLGVHEVVQRLGSVRWQTRRAACARCWRTRCSGPRRWAEAAVLGSVQAVTAV